TICLISMYSIRPYTPLFRSRGVPARGMAAEQAGGLFRIAAENGHRLQQAAGGVQAVIETVPALLEEQVAAHLAAEQGADFLHLGLDHRMSGLPHHRTSAQLADQLRQAAGALDVEYDVRARVAGH